MKHLLFVLALLFVTAAHGQAIVLSACGTGAFTVGQLHQLTMNPAGYLCVSTTTLLGTTIREGQGALPQFLRQRHRLRLQARPRPSRAQEMRFLATILLLLLALPAHAQQGQGMSRALVVSSCGAAALPTSGPLTNLRMNPQGLCMTGVASLGPPVTTSACS